MKAQCGVRIRFEFASLTALVVGVKHEATLVDAAQENYANRWAAIGIGGGQSGWRRVDPVRFSVGDGFRELGNRIGCRHVEAWLRMQATKLYVAIADQSRAGP